MEGGVVGDADEEVVKTGWKENETGYWRVWQYSAMVVGWWCL
jgi:hypothetical protein